MNEIEKLDLVLRHMAAIYPQPFAEKHGVIAKQILEKHPDLKVEGEDFTAELYFILQKLVEDGYVIEQNIPQSTWPFFALTFNGAYFIRNKGGYITLYEMEIHRKKIQSLKDWMLICGTWLAGFGAVALVFWEMYIKGIFGQCN